MDDGGASEKHLKAEGHASNNKRVVFKQVIATVITDHGSECRPDSETNLKGTGHGSDSDSSDTESSTSSNSTFDDFILLNPQIPPKFRVPSNIPKPNGGAKPLHKNEEFDVSNEALYRVKECNNESPKSIPRVSDVTHEYMVSHISPVQSPPVQVMERSGGFDPCRIPASVFSRPTTSPMDWSAASNDSLFSIHIGNSSFSKDYIPGMGIDLQKEVCESGEPSISLEAPQWGEVYNSGELYRSGEPDVLSRFGQTVPTTKGGHKKSSDVPKTIGDSYREIEMMVEPINYVPMALMNNQVDTNKAGSMDANFHHPDKSETTIQISSFPRKKKSSCLPSHCSDCWRIFCCCKWSSCPCKWICWPNCSSSCLRWKSCCCKWPSCRCKCLTWSSCCCKCCCKFQCSNCTWACYYCKRVCCESSHIATSSKIGCSEHQHAKPPNSMKQSSRRRWSCFSCKSTCSWCACCSCSCCC